MPRPAENGSLFRQGVECGVDLDRRENRAVLFEFGLLPRVEYALPFSVAPTARSEQDLRHLKCMQGIRRHQLKRAAARCDDEGLLDSKCSLMKACKGLVAEVFFDFVRVESLIV